MDWDKKNLSKRVEKARGGVPFAKIEDTNDDGLPVRILCPGTEGAQYEVRLHWYQERLTTGAHKGDKTVQQPLIIGDKPEHFRDERCFDMNEWRVGYVTQFCTFTGVGRETTPRIISFEDALAMSYPTVSFEVVSVEEGMPCPGNTFSTLSYHAFTAFIKAMLVMKRQVMICAVEEDALRIKHTVTEPEVYRLRSWDGGGLLWAVVYGKR